MKAMIMAVGLLLPMAAHAECKLVKFNPPKDVKVTRLTDSQFWFAMGVYAQSPPQSPKLIDTTGGLLAVEGDTAMIFWTKGVDNKVCEGEGLVIPTAMLPLFDQVLKGSGDPI